MLNPKLREIYSDSVLDALGSLSEEFENRNIWAGVYGVKGESINLKAPVLILTMDNHKEFRERVWSCYREYTEGLSGEEDESLAGLVYLGGNDFYSKYKKGAIPLWVK